MEPESHEQAHESIKTFLETEKQQLWDRIRTLEDRVESWFSGSTVGKVEPQPEAPQPNAPDVTKIQVGDE